MTFVNYAITQPYFYYVEETEYNVIPAIVTLTFDTPPSSIGSDYVCIVTNSGDMNASEILVPSTYDQTLVVSGNTATITMSVIYDECVIVISYQGSNLPFYIRVIIDTTYQTPSIWQGFPSV